MPKIVINGVSKKFISAGKQEVQVLSGLSFEVEKSEIVCILGPSGCGKTTLINLLAGYTLPDNGRIFNNNIVVRGPSVDRAVVFQDHALFPWKTVKGNIGFGLKFQKISNASRNNLVERYINKFNLHGFNRCYPYQLSGGMKQRVGLARALAAAPETLLLDEPFSSLDEQNRELLQEDLLRLHYETKPTIIFVTHNIDEAIFLADKIVILTKRPGSVKSIIKVPFSRPRYYGIKSSPEFFRLHSQVWQILREEVMTV